MRGIVTGSHDIDAIVKFSILLRFCSKHIRTFAYEYAIFKMVYLFPIPGRYDDGNDLMPQNGYSV